MFEGKDGSLILKCRLTSNLPLHLFFRKTSVETPALHLQVVTEVIRNFDGKNI